MAKAPPKKAAPKKPAAKIHNKIVSKAKSGKNPAPKKVARRGKIK